MVEYIKKDITLKTSNRHLFKSKVQILLLCFIYSSILEAGQYI